MAQGMREANRREIISAAASVLAAEQGASMAEVAAAAGIARATLYRYFPTRETLCGRSKPPQTSRQAAVSQRRTSMRFRSRRRSPARPARWSPWARTSSCSCASAALPSPASLHR